MMARKGFSCTALAVVHYKLGELEQSQDLYARAYDIQVHTYPFASSQARVALLMLMRVHRTRSVSARSSGCAALHQGDGLG